MVNHVLSQHNFVNLSFFEDKFIKMFYFTGLVLLLYVILRLLLIIIFYKHNKNKNYYLSDQESQEELHVNLIQKQKILIDSYVKQNIIFLLLFLLCYLPNNLVVLLDFFSFKYKSDSKINIVFQIFMSLSCFLTFIFKISEMYMMKIFRFIYEHLRVKNSDNKENNLIKINDNSHLFNSVPRRQNFSIIPMHALANPYNYLDLGLKNLDLFSKLVGLCTCLIYNKNEYFSLNQHNIPAILKKYSQSNLF